MNTIGAETFLEVVASALERMAFVFVEPATQTPGEVLAMSVAHASIAAAGPANLELCVSATPGLILEVASGMLGLDVEEIEVDDHSRSVVSELANILGGELIMQMTGGNEGMVLGLPCDTSDEEAASRLDNAGPAGFCIALAAETGQLLVTVRVA